MDEFAMNLTVREERGWLYLLDEHGQVVASQPSIYGTPSDRDRRNFQHIAALERENARLRKAHVGRCGQCGRRDMVVYDDLEAYICVDQDQCNAWIDQQRSQP